MLKMTCLRAKRMRKFEVTAAQARTLEGTSAQSFRCEGGGRLRMGFVSRQRHEGPAVSIQP